MSGNWIWENHHSVTVYSTALEKRNSWTQLAVIRIAQWPAMVLQQLRLAITMLSPKVCTKTNDIDCDSNTFFSTGLLSWREAVSRSVTSSQLSMALYTLEQCVAWDKSIMKAVSLHLLSFTGNFIIFLPRIVNFVSRVSPRISFYFVMDVIEATTLTASSLRWRRFLKVIGRWLTTKRCSFF